MKIRKLLIVCLLILLQRSAQAENQPRQIQYLTAHQIKELVGCEWLEICNRSGVNLNRFLFHNERNNKHFVRWRNMYEGKVPRPRLYVPCSQAERARTRKRQCETTPEYSWRPHKGSETEFFIFQPTPEDAYSAFLIETVSTKLRRVYRMPSSGTEIEFRPLEAVPAPSVHNRALIKMSQARIRDFATCEWNEACSGSYIKETGEDTIVDLNEFLYQHERGGVFSRWRALYDSTNPVTREKVDQSWWDILRGTPEKWLHISAYFWTPSDESPVVYFNSQPNPNDCFSALLYETTSGNLTGVYRVRPNRTEQEFRPLHGDPELPVERYRWRETWRRRRSTHHEDLKDVQHEFFTPEQLKRKYGLSWGDDFGDVQKAKVLRGYRLVDPRQLFKAQDTIKTHDWYMPDWNALRETTSERSWLTSEGQVYLYFRSDNNVVRLLLFGESGGVDLTRVYEYSSKHRMRVLNPATQQAVPILSRKISARLNSQITWGSSTSETETPALMSLATPIDFFEKNGSAFSAWKRTFASRPDQGDQPSGSWTGKDGSGYRAFQSRNWNDAQPQKPSWYILQYVEDKLSAVHHFDETWAQRTYVPYVPPPFVEFLQEHNGKDLPETTKWLETARWDAVKELKTWTENIVSDHYEAGVPNEAQALLASVEHRQKVLRKLSQTWEAIHHARKAPPARLRIRDSFRFPDPRELVVASIVILLLVLILTASIRTRRAANREVREARERQR